MPQVQTSSEKRKEYTLNFFEVYQEQKKWIFASPFLEGWHQENGILGPIPMLKLLEDAEKNTPYQ